MTHQTILLILLYITICTWLALKIFKLHFEDDKYLTALDALTLLFICFCPLANIITLVLVLIRILDNTIIWRKK